MGLLDQEQLAKSDWGTLLELRKSLERNDPRQAEIAPFEHRAYARMQVAENPLVAPVMAAMIPGYQLQKMLPKEWTGNRSRTDPSLEQMKQGFIGIGEGVKEWWRR